MSVIKTLTMYSKLAAACYASINPTAAEVLQTTYAFGAKNIAPINREIDDNNEFPDAAWKQMGDAELHGLTAEEEHGGLNLGYVCHLAAIEAISYNSGSVGLSYIAHSNLCINQLVLNGTEAQKEKFLPKLISGEHVGALAMSEPNAGSDVMSMTTRAEKVDGGYNLKGQKLWITNGGKADIMVVYAVTSPPGEKVELTAFIVEKGMPGFKPGKKIDKTGMRGSETYEIFLDDCFVPEENVLGKVGKGAHVLMSGLEYERLSLSAGAIGIAQSSLDIVKSYLGERTQFGKKIGQFQAAAHEIAQMEADLEAARNDMLIKAHMADQDKAAGRKGKDRILTNRMSSTTFLKSAQASMDICKRAIVLAGGMGYTKEMALEQNARDTLLYLIGGGTEHIRREVIARDALADTYRAS